MEFEIEKVVIETLQKADITGFEGKRKIVCNMWFYFVDKRCRDTHNQLKILFDALQNAGLFPNDMYVLPRVQDFYVDRKNPRIEMELYYLEG